MFRIGNLLFWKNSWAYILKDNQFNTNEFRNADAAIVFVMSQQVENSRNNGLVAGDVNDNIDLLTKDSDIIISLKFSGMIRVLILTSTLYTCLKNIEPWKEF